jgi:hypothetical protein
VVATDLRTEIERFGRERLLPVPRGISTSSSDRKEQPRPGERDWNYRSVEGTIQLLTELRSLQRVDASELPVVTRVIRTSLAVGGAQGALFAVDTMLEQPETMEGYIRTWNV